MRKTAGAPLSLHPSSRRPTRARAWRAAAALLIAATAASAQEEQRRIERALRLPDAAGRLRIDPDLSITERSFVDIGGFFNFTALNLNDEVENSRRLLQYDATLYGQASLDGAHTAFFRSRFRYRDFSPGDSFTGRGDEWAEPFLDRYWYEFDLRRAAAAYQGRSIDTNVNLRVGRQFVDWGAGLALSEVLYAVQPTVSWKERFSIEGLAGITPGDEEVVDFDAARDAFNRDTERGFFGALLRYRTEQAREVYAFALHMQDYNTDTLARFGVLTPVDFNYEATYLGIGTTGSLGPDWLYLGEFVYQLGESTTDPLQGAGADPALGIGGAQREEDIYAFAGRAQLTYLLRDRNDSRFQLETIFASGDSNRGNTSDTVGGNQPGTDDNAFNSLGFANTGLAFAPSLSNILTVRAGASTFPFKGHSVLDRFQVGADIILLNKFDEAAPIDEPTRERTFLGVETDLYLNYRVTSDLALNVRYGAFFPGTAIAGEHDTRHFVLFGITLSF